MNLIEESLADLKSQGHKVVGCFPLYPPQELIHSMGLTPVILWGLKPFYNEVPGSDRHLQAYTCSVGRYLTELVLRSKDTCLDGLVMYNACDTLRNLPEILDIGLGKECDLPIYSLHVPALPMEQEGVGRYLRDSVNAFISWLEETFQTRFSAANFQNSIALYSKARQLMAQGQVLVRQGKTSFVDYAALCREIGFMPVEKQISLLKDFCAEQGKHPGHDNGTKPVLLSGILPPAEEIIQAMEAAGLRIAANDIASLHRAYAYSPPETDDPATYYIHFYDKHFPCTTLLPLADKRMEALGSLMDSCRAEGFVFVGEKFCEYEYLELPYLEKKFREKGLKVLSLEFSLGAEENLGPVKTRIEAFAEMMG